MKSSNLAFTLVAAAAFLAVQSAAHAQVYSYRSDASRVPQSRVIVGTPNHVYSSNGVQYQSLRPNYGSSQVYSNGRYYVQPGTTYYSNPTPHYRTQSVPPYYSNGNSNQIYYGNQRYWNQPSTTYQSNYGTGFYVTPRQAANANAGAIIGGAIGGNQGAQFGAAVGATIRP